MNDGPTPQYDFLRTTGSRKTGDVAKRQIITDRIIRMNSNDKSVQFREYPWCIITQENNLPRKDTENTKNEENKKIKNFCGLFVRE
jgi:hypothetical protein